MLTFSLTRILNIKGIDKPYSYLRKQGYGSKKSNWLVFGKKSVINLDEVEKFCLEYKCTPNDLLSWSPSKMEDDYPENPLQLIRRDDDIQPVLSLMDNMSNQGIAELEKYIQKRKNKTL